MHSPRESTISRPGLTEGDACDIRARAWAFAIEIYRKKKAAPASRPDDAERSLNDGARNIIQDAK
jgi:hypothetical protein